MTKKGKYFPNNWKAYKESPDNFFIPLAYDEFYHWKVMGWALPSSVACIIREETDGKITERVYSQSKSARKYLQQEMGTKDPRTTYTICDRDAVQLLYPKNRGEEYEHLEESDSVEAWDVNDDEFYDD